MKNTVPKIITIMWFHTFGQMKTLKVTSKTLKNLIYLSIFLVFIGIISISLNIFFFFCNRGLVRTISDLEIGIENTKEICFQKENELFYEEDNIDTNKTIKKAETIHGTVREEVKVDSITDSVIKISNIQKTLDFDSNYVLLSFHLKHIKDENRNTVSGYVILVGKNEDISDPIYSTFPNRVTLNNNFPADYRQGDPFYIKNLKVVQGRIKLNVNNTPIREVVIYVFSKIGELLLEKTIDIGVLDD